MSPMQLPRWLIVSMLSASALATISVAAWWWVIWPERRAWELIRLWDSGQFVETNGMLSDVRWEPVKTRPNDVGIKVKSGGLDFARARWESCTRTQSDSGLVLTKEVDGKTKEEFSMLLRPRSLTDVLVGRQVLRFKSPYRSRNGGVAVDFTVERRSIRGHMLTDAE